MNKELIKKAFQLGYKQAQEAAQAPSVSGAEAAEKALKAKKRRRRNLVLGLLGATALAGGVGYGAYRFGKKKGYTKGVAAGENADVNNWRAIGQHLGMEGAASQPPFAIRDYIKNNFHPNQDAVNDLRLRLANQGYRTWPDESYDNLLSYIAQLAEEREEQQANR